VSKITEQKRITVPDIRARKGGIPLVSLTAYTYPIAQALDASVDILMVGDSLGMVLYGMPSTLPVTLDMMIAHAAAVVRGSKRAHVVVDLPFATYQESPEAAFRSAARVLVESGAQSVKLEGGSEMAETVRFLVERGVPVMGHVGLMPQSANVVGGYRARGRETADGKRIVADAKAIAAAGAYALVIEGTVEPIARKITQAVPIPTIGIGASPACDGQVLVIDDILGLFQEFTPKFVKRYADIGAAVEKAARAFAEDVRARRFPTPEHCFGVKALTPRGRT